jgi:hypothetical protein
MWRERGKKGERTGLVFKIMSKKTGLAFKKKWVHATSHNFKALQKEVSAFVYI